MKYKDCIVTYLTANIRSAVFVLLLVFTVPVILAEDPYEMPEAGDSLALAGAPIVEVVDSLHLATVPSLDISLVDTITMPENVNLKIRTFNPDPTRAVWLSALFPGLGQVYNRRYWKLPIVVGGFMGIAYALDWNNRMLSDYTIAYGDIMDNDPSTKRYLDFFPSYIKEEDLDPNWLKKILKSRKDFYRRNRDLSIICMAGMYFLCMLDAYVDASLSHFDISPDISMDVSPSMLEMHRNGIPSFGISWAINF